MDLGDWLMANRDRADRRDAAIGALSTLQGYGAPQPGESSVLPGYTPPAGNDPGGEMDGGSPELDQAEAQGKKANAIRSVISAYNPNPQSKTALQAMSLGQLEGMLKGYALKSAMEERAALINDRNAQAMERQQRAIDDQSIGQAVNRYSNAPDVATALAENGYGEPGPGPSTTMRPATPEERFRYALATPGLSGRAVPKLIEALTKYGQAAEDNTPTVLKDNPYPGVAVVTTKSGRGGIHVVQDPNAEPEGQRLSPTYTEDPITGARALLYGKSAQPTGFNPAKAGPQLMAQHDDEGNLVGWSHVDARGHATFTPNKSNAKLKLATDDQGNVVPGYYMDSQGKMHDTRSAMEKSLGISKAPAAATQYKSQQDVVAAFKAGKLQRAEAAKILNEQFGVPLK